MTKTYKTLKEDIYHVVTTGEGWTKEISEWFQHDAAKSLERQFGGRGVERKGGLRASNLGTKCNRKLWYTVNSTIKPQPLSASTLNKFIFGDLTESYILALAKAAGHRVEGLQGTVDVCGIRGSRDCIIDGMLFDVKSASSFGFKKFKEHGLREDDPFAYISQLSTYLYGSRDDPLLKYKTEAGFLAFDKQHGHVVVDVYDLSEELAGKEAEVQSKKDAVAQKEPPERIADAEVPQYKTNNGNMKLNTNCSYCDFKNVCWPELRTFLYSSGPVYLTKVVKEPRPDVWEVKE